MSLIVQGKFSHIANMVSEHLQDFDSLQHTHILSQHTQSSGFLQEEPAVPGATVLDRNEDRRRRLADESPEYLIFDIPLANGETLVLLLYAN